MKVTDNYVFFCRGVLGNWHRTPGGIKVEGVIEGQPPVTLPTSEHIFMWLKACYFGDADIASKILTTSSAREAKDLGRQVKGFSEEAWEKFREFAMYTAIRFRFMADAEYRETIMSPELAGKTFVEGNPRDTIWAVGLSEDDPAIEDPANWRGLNLLGKLITRLRDENS